MTNDYCESCKHWLKDDDDPREYGWCSRYAPKPVWLPIGTVDVDGHWWMPKTFGGSWCGEWEQR